MDDVTRRQAIKAATVGAVATGAVALGGENLQAQDRDRQKGHSDRGAGPLGQPVVTGYSHDPLFDDVVIFEGVESAYGATVHYKVVQKSATRYCLEGKLSYGGIIPLGGGNLCIEQTGPGNYTTDGKAEIKVAGKVVARGVVAAVLRITDAGTAEFVSAKLRVCGTNTMKLKCKDFSALQVAEGEIHEGE
jgi:hypothetical protein